MWKHVGPTGNKCQRIEEQLDSSQEELGEQALNVNMKDTCITQEQARLVAQQVEGSRKQSSEDTEVIGEQMINASQDLILQELKNISKKFGQLEHQAARDGEILTGLVNKVNQQSMEGPCKKVNTTASSLFTTQNSDNDIVNVCLRKKSGTKASITHKPQSSTSITSMDMASSNVIQASSMTQSHNGINWWGCEHMKTRCKLDLSHRRTDANCIHQKKTHQSHSNIV